MYKIRQWIARKLIGKCSISFHVKGKGTTSQVGIGIVPDIYIDGKSIISKDSKHVTLIWK